MSLPWVPQPAEAAPLPACTSHADRPAWAADRRLRPGPAFLLGGALLLAVSVLAPQAWAQSGPVFAGTDSVGQPGGPGSADGTGSAARFNGPSGVAVDRAGNLYVTANHALQQVTPTKDGVVVTTLAGRWGHWGHADGTSLAARFDNPSGLAVDRAGNLYVADTGNHTIRKVTPRGVGMTLWEVTTLAGSPGAGGSEDGMGRAARFRFPRGVAVDSAGNVYVADTGNHTIRKVTPAGVVTTLAGLPREVAPVTLSP